MKLIEVPVSVMAEVSGRLKLEGEDSTKGPGRITVRFFKNDTIPVASTETEADGTFSYMGLQPGTYTVKPDAAQLGRLGVKAEPAQLPLNIRFKMDGDVVGQLDFRLKKTE